jgi:hypothetical protein
MTILFSKVLDERSYTDPAPIGGAPTVLVGECDTSPGGGDCNTELYPCPLCRSCSAHAIARAHAAANSVTQTMEPRGCWHYGVTVCLRQACVVCGLCQRHAALESISRAHQRTAAVKSRGNDIASIAGKVDEVAGNQEEQL